MRVKCPKPFSFTVNGPEGPYTLHFQPIDEWDGEFIIEGLQQQITLDVLEIKRSEEGELTFLGWPNGTEEVWDDFVWFEARPGFTPPQITLTDTHGITRVDQG